MAQLPDPRPRRVNEAYKGKNTGFLLEIDPIPDPASENANRANGSSSEQAERKGIRLRRAIERHRAADEVLEARGFYFPGYVECS